MWSGRLCCWPAEETLDPARGRQKDPLATTVLASTRETLYLFTADGRAVIIPMHQVPKGSGPGEGPNLSEFSLESVGEVVAGMALPQDELSGFLFLASRQGRVKRITLEDVADIRGTVSLVMVTGMVLPALSFPRMTMKSPTHPWAS